MFGIGRGTDPNLNNELTIAFDKLILEGLEQNRPVAGYPTAQEKGIREIRARIEAYEAEHGAVDAHAINDQQGADQAMKLTMLGELTKSLGIK